MDNPPILTTAHQTLRGVLTDLQEAADRLSSSLALGAPMDDLETERWARVLDRLAEETAEAAGMLRASR
jgi:hypothetical protein